MLKLLCLYRFFNEFMVLVVLYVTYIETRCQMLNKVFVHHK